MSRSGRLAVLLLALLAARAEAVQGVHGMVYGEDRDDPVSGALVVLYDSDELLVDSTYSRDDGSFTLRPPQRPGPASIVATRGGLAHREEIAYDPAQDRPVWVPLTPKRESRLKQSVEWGLDKLGAVIGLLVGYGFRVLVEERGEARRKRADFVSDLRYLASQALAPYADNEPNLHLAEITAAVAGMRQLVDRRSDMPDVLSTLKLTNRAQARARFRMLEDKLKEAADLLAQAPKLPDTPRDQKLAEARKILVQIRDQPLELSDAA